MGNQNSRINDIYKMIENIGSYDVETFLSDNILDYSQELLDIFEASTRLQGRPLALLFYQIIRILGTMAEDSKLIFIKDILYKNCLILLKVQLLTHMKEKMCFLYFTDLLWTPLDKQWEKDQATDKNTETNMKETDQHKDEKNTSIIKIS